MRDTVYSITYRLDFEDGLYRAYTVDIERDTLLSRVERLDAMPEWTRLENNRCEGCAYEGEHCPIALRLAAPIASFSNLPSYTPAVTTVTTPERDYRRECDVQEALRSLFGLIMATSGCPAMRPFRYMARYHLPFSTLDETIARITAAYLLGQLFRHADDEHIDYDIADIQKIYNTMEMLNNGMAKRLRGAAESDGVVNSIIILNSFSTLIPIVIEAELAKLRQIF